MSDEQRTLTREVEVTLIPQGTPMTLPEGEAVTITHRLGSNFTVMTQNGMFRISGANADALGEEVADSNNTRDTETNTGPVEKETLWEALKTVFDPEIPVNIVDLGLVYSLECSEHETGGNKVDMQMTLTAPGCGMGPVIADDAKARLEAVSGVTEASVADTVVWPYNVVPTLDEDTAVLAIEAVAKILQGQCQSMQLFVLLEADVGANAAAWLNVG